MNTIRAFAQAAVWQTYADDREPEQVTDPQRLVYFTGLEYRAEAFADYLGDGAETAHLARLGVQGGYIRLEFSAERNELIAITEYTCPVMLSAKDLALLADYTSGQWTDGAGSNFSQAMAEATGVSVDLWPPEGDFIVQAGS